MPIRIHTYVSIMAYDCLAILATSVPVQQVFPVAGQKRQRALSKGMLDA